MRCGHAAVQGGISLHLRRDDTGAWRAATFYLKQKCPGLIPGIRILNRRGSYAPTIGMRGYSPGVPAGVIGMPPSEYSLSLLRSVRIEMPRMLAAWVRLPRQCFNVS